MKKLTTFGISFAVVMLFLYLIAGYDLSMVLTRNQTYFTEHYNSAIKAYFTDYPIILLIVWISHVLAGILSPVCYLFKKKWALHLAGLAFWGDTLLVIITSLFRNRMQIFGSMYFYDLGILALLGLYYWYLSRVIK